MGWVMISMIPSFLWFDSFCQRYVSAWSFSGDIDGILEFVGLLGHGITTTLTFFLIWNLDKANRIGAILLVIAVFNSGVTTTILKIIVHRPRPFVVTKLETQPEVEPEVWNGFKGSDYHSFPSGHSTVAFALATSLSILYPQGARLFFVLAVMVALQRVITQAHYPSDVLAGALVGITTANLVFYVYERWIKPRFD